MCVFLRVIRCMPNPMVDIRAAVETAPDVSDAPTRLRSAIPHLNIAFWATAARRAGR